MTTPDNTQNTSDDSTSPRPFGFWLRVIDRRLDEAMRELFAEEGITRRDWRRLNLVAGTVTDPRMSERLAARPERVEPLVERGWVEGEPGAWRLTEAGETARASLQERVATLRAKVAGAVSPEDFATTMASLEAIAGELGWVEGERMPRRHGRGFGRRQHGEGFGRRHGEGFGPRDGDWHGRGHRDWPGRGHGESHGRCGHGHGAAGSDMHVHVHVHGDAGQHGHPREHGDHGHEGHGPAGHGRGRNRA
ncbi:MarR family winged helix-turn-helix transcriptional regulator [Agromyces sp. NPDC056379]|uniref:MarR family winged helix-turn-helix transcriptional regulator n=1 Tax=unclassified Agromyces TaxID=2639701 RepID=UPI0035DFED6B